MKRPRVVVFDLIETLFSLDSIKARFREAGLQPVDVDAWILRTIADGFALALCDDYRPFADAARSALEVTFSQRGIPVIEEQMDYVADGFSILDPCADARPALQALYDTGVDTAVISIGSIDGTRALIERAGLKNLVGWYFSCDAVRRWKPDPAAYDMIVDELVIPRDEIAYVSVHGWDLHGAKRAGFTTGWSSSLLGSYPSEFAEPDITGANLTEVVMELLALTEARQAA